VSTDETLIDAREAARALGISRSRLYAATRNALVPAVRIGRSYRYSPSVLRRFIESGGTAWPGGWRRDAAGCVAAEGNGPPCHEGSTDTRPPLTRRARSKRRSR
jgi:excisionase family DNA binding protein